MSDLHGPGDPAGAPGVAGDPTLPPPPDNSLLNDFLQVRALAQHINDAARLDAFAAAHDAAPASSGGATRPPISEPDRAAPGSVPPNTASQAVPQAASPGPIAPKPDPNLAADDTIPLGLKLQLGLLGSNAWNLSKQAFAPEVNAYQNFIVRPFETTLRAVAQTPLGDPGFYASMEGVPVVGLIGGAGAEVATGLRWLTRVGPDTRALAARAQEVHDILAADPIAHRNRTTVVLQTDGGKIVAGGTRDLDPIQRDALGPGEIPAKLRREHAEVTALSGTKAAGFKPEALASTRTICPECEAAIEAEGGWLTSPTTAVFGP
jgi:hypothetical protein